MSVYIKGRITITPPLQLDEISEEEQRYIARPWDRMRPNRSDADACFAAESITYTDDRIVSATIVGIEARYPTEGFSNYDLAEDTERLMRMHPDRTYAGYLECNTPDDGGSLWRLVPDGVSVRTIQPKITVEWPE
jgi:hypothetical protein